ncbi:hypothetical protein B0H13DRAFT_2388132 [Mycena leptocephala]|nr:hypothetical protein B0H13DRAFT_2388132 [Mycena leptocephala]
MRTLRHLLTLSFVSVAWASKLDVRQATNTNVAINKIIDNVDVTMQCTKAGPTISSSGSTTVSPTNNDISITLSDTMQYIGRDESVGRHWLRHCTGLQSMATTLDPIIAKALSHFNSTLPGGLTLVHTMYGLLCLETLINTAHRMLDASQFLRVEGFVDTLKALKF